MLRDHAELSQEMGDEDGGEKKGAGDSDERKKEIDRFLQRGKAARPDGEEIDQKAEPQTKEKTHRFNHGPDCSAPCGAPSRPDMASLLSDQQRVEPRAAKRGTRTCGGSA